MVTAGEDHFPLTTRESWQRFTDAVPAEPKLLTAAELELISDAARADYDHDRADYHSRLVVVATPTVRQVFAAGRRLVLLNHHQVSARRGLIITGAAGTGKTTAVTQLGRNHELLLRNRLGHQAMAGRMPVVYVTVPPAATPKMLASEFARFAGVPVNSRQQNQADITNAVCNVLARLRTDLVLVDEIHNLNLATRAGADASDQLKYLAERIPATFIYAGIDVEGSGLFAGTRGQQIAGRFGMIACDPFPYGTTAQRQQWQALIATLEQSLRLHRHQPSQLLRLDGYLHERTNGMIGSLSHLIRGAAVEAILDGTEKITRETLDRIGLDHAAEATRTRRKAASRRRRDSADEPLRRLAVPARLITRETIGSFLTRLAFANSLRVPRLLWLAAITARGSFTPATDDTRGWTASTPDRIAALAGRPLPELGAAIPLLATMTPADAALLRACGHCAAAKNIAGMVIIRARPRDYLCARHQQWLRGIRRPSLAALPEVTDSQRRHDRRTANIPDQDIARAHRQARDITSQWLSSGWHPALTERWQHRHHRLAASAPGPEAVLTDVITHPEMLAVARLLMSSQRSPGIRPRDIAARLGFPYPGQPHPLDPLNKHLSQLRRAKGDTMAIDIPARLRDEDFATCLVKRYLAPGPRNRPRTLLRRVLRTARRRRGPAGSCLPVHRRGSPRRQHAQRPDRGIPRAARPRLPGPRPQQPAHPDPGRHRAARS